MLIFSQNMEIPTIASADAATPAARDLIYEMHNPTQPTPSVTLDDTHH